MEKTKQELEALHRLFLSEDSDNWELGAMMCSLEDFNAVIELEVKRLANTEDFEFSKTRDEDSDGLEYEHSSIMATRFFLYLEWGVNDANDTWLQIQRWAEVGSNDNPIYWSELELEEQADGTEEFNYWKSENEKDVVKGEHNQYLTDDFKSELEAVKEYWREQFLTTKNTD